MKMNVVPARNKKRAKEKWKELFFYNCFAGEQKMMHFDEKKFR